MMALQIGSRLGSYEITAHIGVGGMGEVYRASWGLRRTGCLGLGERLVESCLEYARRPYIAVQPSSTGNAAPVTNDDSSDARKSAAAAISSG